METALMKIATIFWIGFLLTPIAFAQKPPKVHTGKVFFSVQKAEAFTHDSNVTVGTDSYGCDFNNGTASCGDNYIAPTFNNTVTLDDGLVLHSSKFLGCLKKACTDESDVLNTISDDKLECVMVWDTNTERMVASPWCSATVKFQYTFITIKGHQAILVGDSVYNAARYKQESQ
jgi:hypothetical protein